LPLPPKLKLLKSSRGPTLSLFTPMTSGIDALSVVQQEQGENARFPWFTTPNLDRIAQEGVRFRNAFVINSLVLAKPQYAY
jgi:N-acetylglucosamine-6-sulfatase